MTDENQQLENLPETDLSLVELHEIDKFIADGKPGENKLTPDLVERIGELYLSGKTYVKIARDLRIPKILVCYLSSKFKWFEQRKILMEDTARHIQGRLLEAKLASQDFLINVASAYQKDVETMINKAQASGDRRHLETIDLKVLDRYLKIVSMLNESDVIKSTKNAKTPAIGLNVGDGLTIEQTDEFKLEVTPKQKALKNMLEEFANLRREQESKSKVPPKSAVKEQKEETNEDQSS